LAATKPRETPLPWLKLLPLLCVNLMNTAFYLMTYPFVPFMISSFYPSMEETDIGFYSGTLEGSFHAGQFAGALMWGSLSDVIGRKPVLLSGLLWTAVCCAAFGLSPNFGSALVYVFVSYICFSVLLRFVDLFFRCRGVPATSI
jgi:MFS family permease